MKKGFRISLIVGAMTVLGMLSSCNKLLDYVNGKDGNGKSVSKHRIKSITGRNATDSGMATFTYNEAGDPVKIWFDKIRSGSPNSLFRYAAKGELTDYITTYEGSYFQTWHRYINDKSGRVLGDTLFELGRIGEEGPASYGAMKVSTYVYDNYGRIAREDVKVLVPDQGTYSLNYDYDIKGNLVGSDTVDNKTCYYRTNSLWQLMSKNYSLNNSFIADEYNSAGLPVKLHYTGRLDFFFLSSWYPWEKIEITYE